LRERDAEIERDRVVGDGAPGERYDEPVVQLKAIPLPVLLVQVFLGVQLRNERFAHGDRVLQG
jgi:hypothetical protein